MHLKGPNGEGTCFTADTKLLARGAWGEGYQRIDEILVDDEVLSRSEFSVASPVAWKRPSMTDKIAETLSRDLSRKNQQHPTGRK